MALLDALNYFDTNSAITAGGPSSYVIDLGTSRDLGVGTSNVPDVEVSFTSLPGGPGGAAVAVQFQTSLDNVTFTTLSQTPAVPVTSIVGPLANEFFPTGLPHGIQRYIRLNYLVSGGPLTAGAVTAKLSLGRSVNKSYPRNYTTP